MKPRVDRFFLLLFMIPIIMSFVPFVSKAKNTIQQNEIQLEITYFNVNVKLVDLDLVARRAHFNLSGSLGFNFNASSDVYYVTVATMRSDVGQIKIVKVTSGFNSSVFQIYQDESFNGYFSGGPETYPFDRYRFNITLSFPLQNVSLAEDNVTFSPPAVDWPLKAQFDEPKDIFSTVRQSSSSLVVSVGFALDRPEWRGYATLLPIYLIFALLGFSMFVRIGRDKLTNRTAIYMAVLTSALAYSISLQSILPPGRYYLSIPEVLVYSVIAGAATFMIVTLLAYRFMINRVMADTIAVIITQAFLSFLLLTFYFAKYVEIDFNYLPARMIIMQWIIIAILFGCIYLTFLSDFSTLLKEPIGADQLNKRLNNIVRRLYLISFVFSLCTSGIIAYELLVPAGIQTGWFISFLLSVSANNILLMTLLLSVSVAAYLSFTYYLPNLLHLGKRSYWIRDFFGFFFAFVYFINFLYGFLLLPADQSYILTSSLIIGVLSTFFFWVIRPLPQEEAYEQFIDWFGI